MVYTIFVVIVTILYLAILELSKNMIIGWVIGIILAAAMIAARVILKKKGKLNKKGKPSKKILALCWLGFFALMIGNYLITAPPEKRVPAVDNANPKVTDVVHLSDGDITGVYNADESVAVYAGIPYAKAPVGDLRFKEPQPAEKWSDIKACDEFAPMAMQNRSSALYNSLSNILARHEYQMKIGDEYVEAMSEDCLYANVFVPEGYKGEKLPVIVYVHGGSLNSGQPSYTEYRGEDLAKQGVIYVNFGYRVGVFGYYAADDLKAESPYGTTGDYGLLDQIQALKWVRDNIATFGGDPDRVTIAGESAGSSSVNALCASPLSEGLFQYAVGESSSVLAYKPYHTFMSYDEAVLQGDDVRKEFNVSTSSQLRDIPADKLVTCSMQKTPCAMTVDGYALTEMPYKTYERGANHEKALLNGFNGKEADVFMLSYEVNSDNYIDILKKVVGDYAEEMTKIVPANTPPRDQHIFIDQLGDAKSATDIVYSAAWFSYSHYLWSNYIAAQNKPCYEYLFNKENNSITDYHAGEIPYLYGNLWRHPGLYNDSDYKLSDIMKKYITNFVKTGDPNGEGLPRWEMYSNDNKKLIQLNDEIKMMDDPNNEIYKVIDKYQEAFKER